MAESTGNVVAEPTLVFIALATTGLEMKDDELLQISATAGEKSFDQYCFPDSGTNEASDVNHLHMRDDGLMYYRDKKVNAVAVGDALEGFIAFLEIIKGVGKITLVAHSSRFHAGFLIAKCKELDLFKRFEECVDGFLCTCNLFQATHEGLSDYSLATLVETFLKDEKDFHLNHFNSAYDAKILRKLFEQEIEPTNWLEYYVACFFHVQCFVLETRHVLKKRKN